MICSIIRDRKTDTVSVYAPSGMPSKLFADINKFVKDQELAIDLYKKITGESFINWIGNEGSAIDSEGDPVGTIDDKGMYFQRQDGQKKYLLDIGQTFVADDIVNKLDNPGIRVNPNKSGYLTDDDVEVGTRITEQVKKEKKESGKFYSGPTYYSELGTLTHSYMEHIVNELVRGNSPDLQNISKTVISDLRNMLDGEGNPIFKEYENHKLLLADAHFNQLVNIANKLISGARKDAVRRGTTVKAIRTEQTIYDPTSDIGGTIDLLIVYEDGSADIFDYKTLFNKIYYSQAVKGYVYSDHKFKPKQLFGYGKQLAIQMDILHKNYGITKFNKTRMIPIVVMTNKHKDGFTNMLSMGSQQLNSSVDPLFKPYPVAEEQSEIGSDQAILTAIRTRIEKLEASRLKPLSDESKISISNEIARLYNAEQNILLFNDSSTFYNELDRYVDRVSNVLHDTDIELTNAISTNILEAINLLEFYSNTLEGTAELTSNDRSIRNDKVGLMRSTANSLNSFLLDRMSSLYDTDLSKLEREKSKSTWLTQMSGVTGTTFTLLNRVIQDSLGKSRIELDAFINWTEDIKKRVGSDSAMREIYDLISDQDTANLKAQLSEEYYEHMNEAIGINNKSFFSLHNYDIVPNFDEILEKKWEAEYLQHPDLFSANGVPIGSENGGTISTAAKKIIEDFTKVNDVREASARINPANHKYLIPKNPHWFSEDYNKILANPLASEIYDRIVSFNREMRGYGIDRVVTDLPSIRKTLAERISSNGMSELADDFLKSITANDVARDGNYGDEEADNRIPSFFQADTISYSDKKTLETLRAKDFDTLSPEDKDKLQDLEALEKRGLYVGEKSTDILTSMTIYAKMAYNYKNMSDIEGTVNAISKINSNKKQLLTGFRGDLINVGSEDNFVPKEGEGNDVGQNIMDTFIRYYIYGEKIQGKDKVVTVNNKAYSATKVGLELKQILSLKALGFNWLSASANFFGAYVNALTTGAGGQYYSKKSFKKYLKWIPQNNAEMNAVDMFFALDAEHWDYNRAADVSIIGNSKFFRYDTGFIMNKVAERPVSAALTMAILDNWTIENGELVKMELASEGATSLAENIEVVDGKLKLPGITDNADNFIRLRNSIRGIDSAVRGATSSEDISAMNTNIIAQMASHFRGWITPTAAIRIKKQQRNKFTGELEIGRYIAFGKDVHELIIAKTAENRLTNLGRLINDVAFSGLFSSLAMNKVGSSDLHSVYSEMYETWKKQNPDIVGTEDAPKDLDEFIKTRQHQFRAAIYELRAILLTLAALAFAGGDWDDDGEKDYKKWWLTRRGYEFLNRASDELSFWVNPKAFDAFINKPIPVLSLLNTAYNLIGNTVDETIDFMFGENQSYDPKGIGYETLNIIPGFRFLAAWITEWTRDNGERISPEKGSTKIQFYKGVILDD